MADSKLVVPVFVNGNRVLDKRTERELGNNGHLECLATLEMIRRGLVPDGTTLIMAPREWFESARGGVGDLVDSLLHP